MRGDKKRDGLDNVTFHQMYFINMPKEAITIILYYQFKEFLI